MVTVDHPDQNRRVSDFAALDHESGTKSLGHGWVDMARLGGRYVVIKTGRALRTCLLNRRILSFISGLLRRS